MSRKESKISDGSSSEDTSEKGRRDVPLDSRETKSEERHGQ